MGEHRDFRSKKLWALLVATTGLVLWAASPAAADNFFVIPADTNGCGVDLQVDVKHHDHARIAYGDITITNLETGATYLQRSRYTQTVTADPSIGDLHIEVVGNIWIVLYPGEPGPLGVVQEPGAVLALSGALQYTLSAQDVVTALSFNGSVEDLCERLVA